jgi:hypothetical protein
MDDREAAQVLERELLVLRGESYANLVHRIQAGPFAYDMAVANGVTYQIEIDCIWDGTPGGNVLVMGSIDDGGWRAVSPLTRSFIKSPDGSFVGE